MTASALPLFAVSDWNRVRLDASHDVALFGPPEFNEHRPDAETLAASISPAAHFVIVPFGAAGELLWNGLSRPVAALVAPVHPAAIVVVRWTEETRSLDHSSLWDAITDPRSQVAVAPTLDVSVSESELPLLAPKSRPLNRTLAARIDQFGNGSPEGTALQAGLALIHDDLETSHEFAQSIEGIGRLHLGDYWHAIMHRREPDYFNSKYWFRRVGSHPVQKPLALLAKGVLQVHADEQLTIWQQKLGRGSWDAMAFIDMCEAAARREQSPIGQVARQIQWLEMLILLRFCERE